MRIIILTILFQFLFLSCKKDVYSIKDYPGNPSKPKPEKPNYIILRGKNANISDTGKNFIVYYGFSDGYDEINLVYYGYPTAKETVTYESATKNLLMNTEIQRIDDTLIVPLNSELNGSPIFKYTFAKPYFRDKLVEYSITKKIQHFGKLIIGPNDSAIDTKDIVAAYNSLIKIKGIKYEQE